MPNYQNGKIYKIVCNSTGRIYIGSTYYTLKERLKKHELDYERYVIGKMGYTRSFDILKDKNYTIELIKDFPCNSRKELEREEGQQQLTAMDDENIVCINKNIMGRTREEYVEYYKEYYKEYQENNREQLKEYHKEWYQKNKEKQNKKFNCPCGGRYANRYKERHFKSIKHKTYLASLSSSSSSTQSTGLK